MSARTEKIEEFLRAFEDALEDAKLEDWPSQLQPPASLLIRVRNRLRTLRSEL